MKLANYISLNPAAGQENELSEFLRQGARIVQATEPETLLWAALQSSNLSRCAIFDTFPTESARDAHFSGQVAAALMENAPALVQGGWDDGVIPNVRNAIIVGAKATAAANDVKLATWIPLTARAGKEQDLADLLGAGAQIVSNTEPQTLYWFALQMGDRQFGILDFFADQAGIDAHFAGGAAAALRENAANLIEDGWDNGVVAGIQPFNVLAFIAR